MIVPPFQRLLDEHREPVYRFLLAAAGPGDADDCFQETFLSALRAYPRLRDGSNLRGWLLTIAHRKALDHHRARHRRAVPVADVAGVGGRADRRGAAVGSGAVEAGSGAAWGVAGAGTAAAVTATSPSPLDPPVWAAVRRLPPGQREAVLHRYVDDLPYREIGRILGCSEAAARQRVRAGLRTLRRDGEDLR